MEVISVEDRLPECSKRVLVYACVGFEWNFYVGILMDSNGKDGFQEFWHSVLGTYKRPNQEFPENLSWSISGHSYHFDKVKYWAELPARPKF